MSWRNTNCIIYEGLEHIVDAFKDNLPCKGHIWNTEGDKDFHKNCNKCPIYHEYKWSEEEDSCYIRATYEAIDKLYRGKKQKLLHEYKLEIEKMCETLDEIISLEKSEKYLIPSTLVDRAEYLKEEMKVNADIMGFYNEEQDRTPLSIIKQDIDTKKEYFKEKYFKLIDMVKSSVLDKTLKTHISNFTAIKEM